MRTPHGALRPPEPVAVGDTMTLAQVDIDTADPTAAFRRAMEVAFKPD